LDEILSIFEVIEGVGENLFASIGYRIFLIIKIFINQKEVELKGKSGRLWRTFFIFCLAVLISQWLTTAQAAQESQKLRDFRAHINKHYKMENLPADQFCAIYGFIFRLQWDKVMQMQDTDEKQMRKQYLEQLWWDLRDFTYREGEKWKNQGVWPSGGEGMFQQFKAGFDMLGQYGRLKREDLQTLGGQGNVDGILGIPSIFEDSGSGGGGNYDDVSVEALSGHWIIKGTYMSTGRHYGQTTAVLHNIPVKNTRGFSLTFNEYGNPLWEHHRIWLLTNDGVIEWIDTSKNTKIQFFRERKDFWSGIAYEYDYTKRINIEVKLSLYRNQ